MKVGEGLPYQKTNINPAEDVFAILNTSGTTGKPKGAMLTHQNLIYSASISNEKLMCTTEDVFLIAVPVFHVFGMAPGIMSAITAGAKIVFMDNYKAIHALELIEKRKDIGSSRCSDYVHTGVNHPRFAEVRFILPTNRNYRSGTMPRRDCQKDSDEHGL